MQMDQSSFETLLATGIANGTISASLRAVHLSAFASAPEVAATLLMDLVADGQVIAEAAEPRIAERGIANPIAGFATLDAAAAALRVPITDLARIAETESQINALVAPLPAPETANAPWLDYRPLSSPPEPWNDSHFERDARRMQAAAERFPELELQGTIDRATWTAYAELGHDPVSALIDASRQERIDNLLHHRETLIGMGQTKIAQQRQVEARLKAEDDERKRIERIEAEARMETRMANPHLGVNGLPPIGPRR